VQANTFLSVRCGSQRKQVPFRNGETLSFPKGELPKAYTVDVLRKVGTAQVSVAGISALGGTVRHEQLEIPSLEIAGSPFRASFTASLQQEPEPRVEGSKKHLAAARAKEYLEKHGVERVLHSMFAQLLERQPLDPLTFMIDHLEQVQDEAEGREVEERDFELEPGLGDFALPGLADSDEVPNLSKHHSFMVDVLRKDMSILERLGDRKTSLGVSLLQCIKPGIDCQGHELVKVAGISAGDQECFELFSEVFNPVISQLHPGWSPERSHCWDSDPDRIEDVTIDPTGRYAVFASMETRRNFQGLRMSTCCSKDERRAVERIATLVMETATGEQKGTYYPLRMSQSHEPKPGGMTVHQEERLRGVGLLFAEPDSRIKLSAGLGRHWPDARGVFVGEMQGLYTWCNEEDHLRFFARQHTAIDLKKLWARLKRTVDSMEQGAQQRGYSYARSDRLGYVTTDPSRLGCALRISVSLRIPLLAEAADLPGLCRTFGLQSTQEVTSASHGGVWSVSTSDCLGTSEVELVARISRGCAALVALEQRLESNEPIYDAMPGLGSQPYPGFSSVSCPSSMPDLKEHHSAMACVLKSSPAIYEQLRDRTTSAGVGLAACIKPGVDDPGHPKAVSAGIVAGDEACYKEFSDLFYPVINRLHGAVVPASGHPFDADMSKLSLRSLDPQGGSVVSVRVELRRNVRGLRLAPCISHPERREVERLLVAGMAALGEESAGEYLPLACSQSYPPRPGGVTWADQSRLCAEDVLFSEPSGVARLSAGIGRDWPDARGSYVAEAQGMHVRCNEEDHLRFIVSRPGGGLQAAFGDVRRCAQALEAQLKSEGYSYMADDRLGYLTVDPGNLGNGLCCSVAMKLPMLSTHPDFFPACNQVGLRTAWQGGAWELSAGPSLCVSEVAMINGMVGCCDQLLALEQKLAEGHPVESELRSMRSWENP